MTQTQIDLKNNNGFKWFSDQNIQAKGYIVTRDGRFYEDEQLPAFFKKYSQSNRLDELLATASGIFSAVMQTETGVKMFCDKVRMFPLFYAIKDSTLFVSDNAQHLVQKTNYTTPDDLAITEYLATSFTTQNNTLYKYIKQLQASEILTFTDGKKKSQFYYNFAVDDVSSKPYNELQIVAYDIFEQSFERIRKFLGNKQIVIPLSGGYDSRLIAVKISEMGYKNVLCFTYGNENAEVETSKKVAQTLGFDWHFVKYTPALINEFHKTDEFNHYVSFSANATSFAMMQEYFAVKYLKDNELINDDAIFIPGHSGDFIGGSQLIKVVKQHYKQSELAREIYRTKYTYIKPEKTQKKQLTDNIANFIKNTYHHSLLSYSIFEEWDFREKLAKVIFNSANVYNFWGYKHCFPFADEALMDFFAHTPYKLKEEKKLYDNVLKNRYFKRFDLNFKKEFQPSAFSFFIQKIKNKIKPVIPYFIRKQRMKANDWINYHDITMPLFDEMQQNDALRNEKPQSYNEILLQWYIYSLFRD